MTEKEPKEKGCGFSESLDSHTDEINPPINLKKRQFSKAMESALDAVEKMQEKKTP